ncbi:ATP-binding cassette domain-containing protein [Acetobacterium carbinolicum]|jgi:ABC-2 type transport system ATP-binding protein|uniref:ATP-binding cassette domain-containing protein n=1 Tax=Acetobacterium TaxID=33951 RepID=UPI000DBECBEC|nr:MULTISPECIES: ATP-binding cassette domain-containing protein [unclassified Acetobacterium]AWW28134.1 ABC transporter ATP-binding protein [Acetobacterium sp. KB-1]MDZ5726148.1 ATP-binding cassette domain-containing protein [Acetobacterium sp. K1/6]
MSMIQVENLIKQYDKAKAPAVKGVSFAVDEGEFFAFLGPNGAGKTTTISILTTTLSKTSGIVMIAGYDIEKEAKQVRDKVGIIFQKPSLDLQLSAEENIRFHACLYGMYSYRPSFRLMPAEYKNRVMELAEIVGIRDTIFKPVKKMSGGMQRKLEIIRSLMHTPAVLFLDEPTQGLDAVSRRSLWEYINNVRKEYGTTVFLTTHYIDEAEHVDKVCIINKGQIASCCSPEEMKKSLLRKEIILDAEDRISLTSELSELGLLHKKDTHIIVPYQNRTPQEIISKLKTKLTVLEIKEPSLEDAYVDYINKTAGAA